MGNLKLVGFSGELLDPSDTGYDDACLLWNAMIDRRPALIARCRSARDVVAAITHARKEGLEVAVRGGGHSIGGLSSTDGGMMIDLKPINGVVVDPDTRRARVGGGALLREMDRATQGHDLATTGGMVHHTGVAGLTLGGGFGWLARLHGLACDNLVSAEMVTASGELLRASEVDNPDLFWGIRGGGGNFGIVTDFEFQLHPIGPMLSSQRRYAAEDAPAILRAFGEVMESAPRGVCSLVGMETARGAGQLEGSGTSSARELYLWYTYAGPDLDEGEHLYGPLRRVASPIAEQTEVMSYADLQSATGEASASGRRHYWKGSLMWELSDAFLDTFLERGLNADGGCGVEMFSLGGAISDVGEEDTAYSNRGASFDMLAVATWDHPKDDDRNRSLTRENWDALVPFARSGVYVNDLGADANRRVSEAYGPKKLERLIALKDKWDPDNTFHLNANIRPSNG